MEEREVCVRCQRPFPSQEQLESGYSAPLFEELEDGSLVCEYCYTAKDLQDALWLILGGVAIDVKSHAQHVRDGKALPLVADWIEETGDFLEGLSATLKEQKDFRDGLGDELGETTD